LAKGDPVTILDVAYGYGYGTTPSGDVTLEIQGYDDGSAVTLPPDANDDGSANYV